MITGGKRTHFPPDSEDMALCEAIIVMARKLGLKVIAEGVETEAQYELRVNTGCDYGQGYQFSKPAPAAEFELLLTQPQTDQQIVLKLNA